MSVTVIGSNGQLGNDVVHAFSTQGHEVRGLTQPDIIKYLHQASTPLVPQSV